MGSYLWSWHRAQLTVSPRKVWETVPIISSICSCRTISRCTGTLDMNPTVSEGPDTRNPVAIMPSRVAGANTSPAICSRAKSRYGLSRLKLRMT